MFQQKLSLFLSLSFYPLSFMICFNNYIIGYWHFDFWCSGQVAISTIITFMMGVLDKKDLSPLCVALFIKTFFWCASYYGHYNDKNDTWLKPSTTFWSLSLQFHGNHISRFLPHHLTSLFFMAPCRIFVTFLLSEGRRAQKVSG